MMMVLSALSRTTLLHASLVIVNTGLQIEKLSTIFASPSNATHSLGPHKANDEPSRENINWRRSLALSSHWWWWWLL